MSFSQFFVDYFFFILIIVGILCLPAVISYRITRKGLEGERVSPGMISLGAFMVILDMFATAVMGILCVFSIIILPVSLTSVRTVCSLSARLLSTAELRLRDLTVPDMYHTYMRITTVSVCLIMLRRSHHSVQVYRPRMFRSVTYCATTTTTTAISIT